MGTKTIEYRGCAVTKVVGFASDVTYRAYHRNGKFMGAFVMNGLRAYTLRDCAHELAKQIDMWLRDESADEILEKLKL